MKKLFFYFLTFSMLFIFFSSTNLYGQPSYSQGFESTTCPSTPGVYCEGYIDDDSCLDRWSTSHGTPRIVGVDPYQGDSCLFMGYAKGSSTSISSEGAFLEYGFVEDSCYLVRFYYKITEYPPGDEILESEYKVELANGLTHNTTVPPEACFEAAATATSSQNIFKENTLDLFEYSVYRKAEVSFKADADYDYLWFYFETDLDINGDLGGIMRIDNLLVKKTSCGFPCECKFESPQIGEEEETTSIKDDTDFDGTISAGCYEIAGTLLIDESTIADGATFNMQPGSEIVVEDGYNFVVSNSKFDGCVQMWKGITVESGATLVLDNNEIYDAQYAVQLHDGSSIWLEDNLFDKNYIGIYAHETLPNYGNITQLDAMDGNRFTCSDFLLLPYENQSPDPGDESLAGFFGKYNLFPGWCFWK